MALIDGSIHTSNLMVSGTNNLADKQKIYNDFMQRNNEAGFVMSDVVAKQTSLLVDESVYEEAKELLAETRHLDTRVITYNSEDINTANVFNQQLIMSNRYLTRVANKNIIDGYNKSYTKPSTDVVSENPWYMATMNGMVDKTGSVVWYASSSNKVRELTIDEKHIVLCNQKLAVSMVKDGIDPTDNASIDYIDIEE